MQLGTTAALGTTNDSIKKNFTTPGTYYIRVFGKNNAFDAALCYTLRVNVSSINFRIDDEDSRDIRNAQVEMQVYPNPVKDILNIKFTSVDNQAATIHVFDMVGKTVLNIPVEAIEGENKYSVDFSEYHKGIYFVEILQNEMKIMKRVILE